ncbi:MAG: hypothetical protein ACRDRT_03935, partial [Pseudonocardiaceae bacterium]
MGISPIGQAPFATSEFGVLNQYSGPFGSQWINIYAGGKLDAGGGNFIGAGIRIYAGPADPNTGGFRYLGEFDAKSAGSWLK